MKGGWVYIMTNAPYGTLHVGVTANLPARIVQHRDGEEWEDLFDHIIQASF